MKSGYQHNDPTQRAYALFEEIVKTNLDDRLLQEEGYLDRLKSILDSSDQKISLREKLDLFKNGVALNPFQIACSFGLNHLAMALLDYYPEEQLEHCEPSLLGIDDQDDLGNTAMHYVAARLVNNPQDPSIMALLNTMSYQAAKRFEVVNLKGQTPKSLMFPISTHEEKLEEIVVNEKAQPGKLLSGYQEAVADPSHPNLSQIKTLFGHFLHDIKHAPPPGQAPIQYIAIQGGGAKGAAYPGAFMVLSQLGYLDRVRTVAGASAGAITSFILGLGFNGEQFKHLSDNINFLDFNDLNPEGWGSYLGGYSIGIAMDLGRYGSAFSGVTFHQWATYLLEQITHDPNITFAEFHRLKEQDPTLKDMIFKATRYGAQQGEQIEQTFSYKHTPDIRIADALRASMAFPGAFQPWPVRYKNGDLFGMFADGGILNNYPIDVFNDEEFYDPHYGSIQKNDHRQKPHQINPCSLGYSLTALDQLNPEITPFTERLKQLTSELPTEKSPPSSSSKALSPEKEAKQKESWSFMHLATGLWWNQVGVAVNEDLIAKQQLYGTQTIQIYPEEVGTLEFTLSQNKPKLARIEASSRNATILWLQHFKDMTRSYEHLSKYRHLSHEQSELKASDPTKFYQQQLAHYFTIFNEELRLMTLRGLVTDKQILSNARLKHCSYYIQQAIQKIEKKLGADAEQLIDHILQDTLQKHTHRLQALHAAKDQRNQLLDPMNLILRIQEKMMEGKNEEVIRILQGQLSYIIPLMRIRPFGQQNLLAMIIQNGDAKLADSAFAVFSAAILRCYHQGRTADLKYSLQNMLNEFCEPPVFSIMAQLPPEQLAEMLKVVLKHGADPLRVNARSKLNGLHEMIIADNFEAFKLLVEDCYAKNAYFASTIYNNESLGHFIIKHASKEFLQSLINDPSLKEKVINSSTGYTLMDENDNTILESAARLTFETRDPESDLRWLLVKKKGSQYHKEQAVGEKKFKDAVNDKLKATEQIDQILTSSDPQAIIKELSAAQCYRILTLPTEFHSEQANQLCALSQQPDQVNIVTALCDKCYQDRAFYPKLVELLNQKFDDQTPLYLAAKTGNARLVTYLRTTFDAQVDSSGPIEVPSALLVAAKNGHTDTVLAFLETRRGTHYLASVRGFIAYNYQITDILHKNALHYLAQSGTPQAFCEFLYRNPYALGTAVDAYGKTPLFYLIENNRMDILKEIISQGKGKLSGKLHYYDYKFADIFLSGDKDNLNLSDLMYAKATNPEIYLFLVAHLTDHNRHAKHLTDIPLLIEKEFAQREREQEKEVAQNANNILSIAKEHGLLESDEEEVTLGSPQTRPVGYTPHREQEKKSSKGKGKEKEKESELSPSFSRKKQSLD